MSLFQPQRVPAARRSLCALAELSATSVQGKTLVLTPKNGAPPGHALR